jgi:Rps23 Pro-64 3,4-dihydroxylase Tpa1-like proline 4-hydroxylase
VINNDLDFNPYRQQLAQRSRVQIPAFLQDSAAERLRDCLQHDVPWTLAERSGGEPRTIAAADYAALPESARQELLAAAYTAARSQFQFVYESYMMVRAAKEGRDPQLILHAILEFLNSEDFLGFARWFTGEPSINAVNAQATRYRAGHFLTRHVDQHSSEGRLFAYVINLTPRWDTDWGGLLQFHDNTGQVIETLSPRWNSLSMFRVPQSHTVSLVAPWAGEDRLAITGWFLNRPA